MAKAPIGKRIIAYIIDNGVIAFIPMAIGAVCFFVIPTVLAMIFGLLDMGGVGVMLGMPIAGIIFAGCALVTVAYALLKDGIRGGRSFGKKLMGLKVVKDGRPCGYMDSLLRNVTLMIPLVGLIDIVMAFVDQDGKRIGDKIAKTQVVEA